MTGNVRSQLLDWKLLSVAYLVGSIGALLQIAGGYWDVSWHTLRIVETFFTPAHLVLYTGVLLIGLAALLGLILVAFQRGTVQSGVRSYTMGLKLAIVGFGLQAFAGGFDQWWHGMYGFDPVLFSPPHAILITGMAVNGFAMASGIGRLISNGHATRLLFSRTILWGLGVIAMAALWLDLNAFTYLITDVNGMALTFRNDALARAPYTMVAFLIGSALLALNGTSVLLAAKRILPRRGSMSLVAVVSAVVSAVANIAFRGLVSNGIVTRNNGGIPQYGALLAVFFALLIPVSVMDRIFTRRVLAGLGAWAGSAVLGLFAFALDGWYTSGLWTGWIVENDLSFLYVAPLAVLAGFLAMGLQRRLTGVLTGVKVSRSLEPVPLKVTA